MIPDENKLVQLVVNARTKGFSAARKQIDRMKDEVDDAEESLDRVANTAKSSVADVARMAEETADETEELADSFRQSANAADVAGTGLKGLQSELASTEQLLHEAKESNDEFSKSFRRNVANIARGYRDLPNLDDVDNIHHIRELFRDADQDSIHDLAERIDVSEDIDESRENVNDAIREYKQALGSHDGFGEFDSLREGSDIDPDEQTNPIDDYRDLRDRMTSVLGEDALDYEFMKSAFGSDKFRDNPFETGKPPVANKTISDLAQDAGVMDEAAEFLAEDLGTNDANAFTSGAIGKQAASSLNQNDTGPASVEGVVETSVGSPLDDESASSIELEEFRDMVGEETLTQIRESRRESIQEEIDALKEGTDLTERDHDRISELRQKKKRVPYEARIARELRDDVQTLESEMRDFDGVEEAKRQLRTEMQNIVDDADSDTDLIRAMRGMGVTDEQEDARKLDQLDLFSQMVGDFSDETHRHEVDPDRSRKPPGAAWFQDLFNQMDRRNWSEDGLEYEVDRFFKEKVRDSDESLQDYQRTKKSDETTVRDDMLETVQRIREFTDDDVVDALFENSFADNDASRDVKKQDLFDDLDIDTGNIRDFVDSDAFKNIATEDLEEFIDILREYPKVAEELADVDDGYVISALNDLDVAEHEQFVSDLEDNDSGLAGMYSEFAKGNAVSPNNTPDAIRDRVREHLQYTRGGAAEGETSITHGTVSIISDAIEDVVPGLTDEDESSITMSGIPRELLNAQLFANMMETDNKMAKQQISDIMGRVQRGDYGDATSLIETGQFKEEFSRDVETKMSKIFDDDRLPGDISEAVRRSLTDSLDKDNIDTVDDILQDATELYNIGHAGADVSDVTRTESDRVTQEVADSLSDTYEKLLTETVGPELLDSMRQANYVEGKTREEIQGGLGDVPFIPSSDRAIRAGRDVQRQRDGEAIGMQSTRSGLMSLIQGVFSGLSGRKETAKTYKRVENGVDALRGSIKKLIPVLGITSANLGMFNVQMSRAGVVIMGLGSMIGAAGGAVLGFATALTAASAAAAGFMAVGALGYLEQMEENLAGVSNKQEAMEELTSQLQEAAMVAIEPLQNTTVNGMNSIDFFIASVRNGLQMLNSASITASNILESDSGSEFVAEVGDALTTGDGGLGRAFQNSASKLLPGITDMIVGFAESLPDLINGMTSVANILGNAWGPAIDKTLRMLPILITYGVGFLSMIGRLASVLLTATWAITATTDALGNFMQATINLIPGLDVEIDLTRQLAGVLGLVAGAYYTLQLLKSIQIALNSTIIGTIWAKVAAYVAQNTALGALITSNHLYSASMMKSLAATAASTAAAYARSGALYALAGAQWVATTATGAFTTALSVLTAHPIIFAITAIIAVLMALYVAFNDVSGIAKAFDGYLEKVEDRFIGLFNWVEKLDSGLTGLGVTLDGIGPKFDKLGGGFLGSAGGSIGSKLSSVGGDALGGGPGAGGAGPSPGGSAGIGGGGVGPAAMAGGRGTQQIILKLGGDLDRVVGDIAKDVVSGQVGSSIDY
ncbi:hypothetical protein [Halosegnis longus]|uniref:hypothetical protein n=1 Tax=Halosegnis longus TaxID=2216012 RepID=UPI00129DDB68|nr:hypothetical protein [Halosegnis longus]